MSTSNGSIDDKYLQSIIDLDHMLFTQRLTRLSAMIVVIYDTLLTMDREIEFFWKQRGSLIKVIYMINRYGGLLFLVIDTWGSVTDYRSESFTNLGFFTSGRAQVYFQQCTGWIAVLLVEIILIIRVSSLYERSRNSTILLVVLFFMQASIMAGILIAWDLVTNMTYFEDVNACGSKQRPPIWLAFFWLPPIITDFFLFVLTLRKSLALRRLTPGKDWADLQLHKTLVRDQALYFIGILICSVANMAFVAFQPLVMCAALGFAFGFPCVMGSRILLNLREIAREEMRCGLSTSKVLTSIHFAEISGIQQRAPLDEDDTGFEMESVPESEETEVA